MQLQLLELESEPHMEVSSNEEVGDGSTACSEARGLCKDEENWESVYLADIITESGFNNADPTTFLAIWHTPESPVSPILSEELEKKYYGQTSWPKPDRQFLFDLVNSGLLETFEQFTYPHPCVRPANKRFVPKWIDTSALEDVLRKLLASQEENVNEENLVKELQLDSLWMDFGD